MQDRGNIPTFQTVNNAQKREMEAKTRTLNAEFPRKTEDFPNTIGRSLASDPNMWAKGCKIANVGGFLYLGKKRLTTGGRRDIIYKRSREGAREGARERKAILENDTARARERGKKSQILMSKQHWGRPALASRAPRCEGLNARV